MASAGRAGTPAWETLLGAITDLTRIGPSPALTEALDTLDCVIVRVGERLGADPEAARELRAARADLEDAGARLAIEQARVGRDLIAIQTELQARARYLPGDAGATVLDRRG